MKFVIFQCHLIKDNADLINRKGWKGAIKKIPSIAIARDLTFNSNAFLPEHFPLFKPVASVTLADDFEVLAALDEVWACSNGRPNCKHRYINFDKAHSLSIGDIIKAPSGQFYIVDSFGFDEIIVKK